MKRTYGEIRKSILRATAGDQKTINEIARVSKVNWKTVQRHLTFFKGMGLITEVFSSSYVRIFQITERGQEELRK